MLLCMDENYEKKEINSFVIVDPLKLFDPILKQVSTLMGIIVKIKDKTNYSHWEQIISAEIQYVYY